jgi:predicted SAM-dependent methyltransferase
MDNKILVIGYGPSKVENSWGCGVFLYQEVDQILDLNNLPWDLPADHFETIYANHVIEHVTSIP